MDVICLRGDRQIYQIVLACSDAVLRRFEFDLASGGLHLAAESTPPESHAFLGIVKSANGVDFLTSRSQCYKTFYGRNLRIFVIS